MTTHFCRLSVLFVLLLCVSSADAATHVDDRGSADRELRIDRGFTVGGQTELKLTVGCQTNTNGRGHLRIYFYERSPQGGWDQINHLRIQFNASQRQDSATITLPPGRYMMTISARRMDYVVLLEDNPD